MTTPVRPRLPAVRRQRPSRRTPEDTRAARAGAWLFRHRGWIPVPIIVVLLLAQTRASAAAWGVGLALVGAGEALRLAGVAAAGGATRRRSRNVERLVTYGIFAWTRNPLYLGNLLAWLGFAVAAGALWFLPIVAGVFAIEYSLIVRYEEAVLDATFGASYRSYRERTPRWIPWPPRARLAGDHSWRAALHSERSTFLAYLAIIVAFAVKQAWL